MIFKRKAVTLVEITIGVVISSILLIGILNLFGSGMRGSAKGMAHQANMQTASILMSQIEYDLLRASKIEKPEYNKKSNEAEWSFYYLASGKNTPVYVSYRKASGGISREVYEDQSHKKLIQKNVFAKDHKVDISFVHFATNTGNKSFSQFREGMWVELTVSSKNTKTATSEPFNMKRLIMVRSNIF